jgi:hypothetical protein
MTQYGSGYSGTLESLWSVSLLTRSTGWDVSYCSPHVFMDIRRSSYLVALRHFNLRCWPNVIVGVDVRVARRHRELAFARALEWRRLEVPSAFKLCVVMETRWQGCSEAVGALQKVTKYFDLGIVVKLLSSVRFGSSATRKNNTASVLIHDLSLLGA